MPSRRKCGEKPKDRAHAMEDTSFSASPAEGAEAGETNRKPDFRMAFGYIELIVGFG